MRRLPVLATLLGVGGLAPFLACGFGAVWVAAPADQQRLLGALVTYGAVILSFLGAVHWGLALQDASGTADRPRLALGILPALVAWAALLVYLERLPDAALAILAAGHLGVITAEHRGGRAGLVPRGYLALRWVLATVVVLILLAVLVIRTTGLHLH